VRCQTSFTILTSHVDESHVPLINNSYQCLKSMYQFQYEPYVLVSKSAILAALSYRHD